MVISVTPAAGRSDGGISFGDGIIVSSSPLFTNIKNIDVLSAQQKENLKEILEILGGALTE